MKLHKDLKEFIGLLNSRRVEYLVVGGHAVAFHGYPRYTGDIDLWVRPSPQNADLLVDVLKTFAFENADELHSSFLEPGTIIQLGRPPNRIDLLTSVSGLTFEEANQEAVSTDLDGVAVRMLGKGDLLANKRASGRTKDLADIEALTGDAESAS